MQSTSLKQIYLRINALNDALLSMLARNSCATLHDNSWDSFNTDMDTLRNITSDAHYQSLKISPTHGNNRLMIAVSNYSIKVYQAVKYLYDTYGDSELSSAYGPTNPQNYNNTGNTFSQTSVLNQDQKNNQTQTTEINIEFNQTLMYITEAVVEAKSKFKEGTKERNFIDKLKNAITLTKNTADLIKTIMMVAVEYGIAVETLHEIFK